MPVGPVRIEIAERREERVASRWRRDSGSARRGPAAARAPSSSNRRCAPAASVGPSMPSVPTLARGDRPRQRRQRLGAAASANSWLRPPRAAPVTRTVVSPLEITHAGRAGALPPASRRARASRAPASRASPTTGIGDHDRMVAPLDAAAARAPSIASRRLPITRAVARASDGSPGFGVSGNLAVDAARERRCAPRSGCAVAAEPRRARRRRRPTSSGRAPSGPSRSRSDRRRRRPRSRASRWCRRTRPPAGRP